MKKKYQEAKNQTFGIVYKNDLKAEVDFKVGDTITTTKDGMGEIEGEIIAVNGQQLTCRCEWGTFYAWSWQSKKVA